MQRRGTHIEPNKALGMKHPTVSNAVRRGERLVPEGDFHLTGTGKL